MDVDDDEDGTQQPRRVQDYGIEVDFESLDDDDREVGDLTTILDVPSDFRRTVLLTRSLSSMLR
jgi:hypothetical protein